MWPSSSGTAEDRNVREIIALRPAWDVAVVLRDGGGSQLQPLEEMPPRERAWPSSSGTAEDRNIAH